jgi:hypothetical protein
MDEQLGWFYREPKYSRLDCSNEWFNLTTTEHYEKTSPSLNSGIKNNFWVMDGYV